MYDRASSRTIRIWLVQRIVIVSRVDRPASSAEFPSFGRYPKFGLLAGIVRLATNESANFCKRDQARGTSSTKRESFHPDSNDRPLRNNRWTIHKRYILVESITSSFSKSVKKTRAVLSPCAARSFNFLYRFVVR